MKSILIRVTPQTLKAIKIASAQASLPMTSFIKSVIHDKLAKLKIPVEKPKPIYVYPICVICKEGRMIENYNLHTYTCENCSDTVPDTDIIVPPRRYE